MTVIFFFFYQLDWVMHAQMFGQTLFWVFLWGCFLVRLTLESVDWVKNIVFQDAGIENRLVDTVGEGEGGKNWERSIETYIRHVKYVKIDIFCKINSQWEFAVWCRAFKPSALWLSRVVGWGGGRLKREGLYLYRPMTHSCWCVAVCVSNSLWPHGL